jgi:hypothetical protein
VNKLKRKFAFAFLTIALTLLFFSPVFAWTLTNQSGYWKLLTREHFIKEGWNDGYAEWQHTLTDFNGYWFKVDVTTWENWREWYQIGVLGIGETSNDLWYKIKIQTTTKTLWIITYYHGYTYWVLGNQVLVKIGVSDNATDWESVLTSYVVFDGYEQSVKWWNPTSFELFVLNEDGKAKVYWFFDIPNQDRKMAVIKEFDGTLGTSATVTLIYQHGGQGKIEAYVTDSFSLPSFPPYEFKGSGKGWLDWFFELMSLDYATVINTLISCIVIFVSFVRLSLPILGFLALFWILDCIISGVVHGEPRIIGDMVMKIYDFLRGVWQTLVNIAQAIWDFITFWG